jgi:hypothetical protein
MSGATYGLVVLVIGFSLGVATVSVVQWRRERNEGMGSEAGREAFGRKAGESLTQWAERWSVRVGEGEQVRIAGNRVAPSVSIKKADVCLKRVRWCESSNRENVPDSRAGARGPFQFLRPTWEEMCGKLGVDWSWEVDVRDFDKAGVVASHYLNVEIPRLLSHYRIPDTTNTRLGAYNWGIGNMDRAWRKWGSDWLNHAPKETQGYIARYWKGVPDVPSD